MDNVEITTGTRFKFSDCIYEVKRPGIGGSYAEIVTGPGPCHTGTFYNSYIKRHLNTEEPIYVFQEFGTATSGPIIKVRQEALTVDVINQIREYLAYQERRLKRASGKDAKNSKV